MSDKEPRRRKKRRESQRKDEMLLEEQSYTSQKNEQRDSDQENEDDHYVAAQHQPSKIAKIVFLFLFSSLVVTMGVVFLSLWGVERGPVDVFEVSHHESHVEEAVHDIHGEMPIPSEEIIENPSLELPHLQELGSNDAEESSETLDFENVMYVDNTDERAQSAAAETEDENIDPLVVIRESTPEGLDEDNTKSTLEYQHTEDLDLALEDENVEELSPADSISEFETVSSEEQNEILESPSSVYENEDITNELDFGIREELDEIDKLFEKSPDKALLKYENLLRLHPHSPRAHFGKAMVLDQMAENERSNTLLEQAIESYKNVLSYKDAPKKLYLMAGTRAVERMRFRGLVGKSIKLLLEMSGRFPTNLDLKKQIAVGYLLIGQNKEAKKAFIEVLKENRDDGFAKVHLGFILKTDENNYEKAAKLMMEGIASKEPGVIDGRFYFHLGDSLARLGRGSEAMKVYEDGVQRGLFLSVYQRSLYNVKDLTGQPWWDPHNTTFMHFIQLLESNWVAIKNEAHALLDEKQSGFLPESESLQEKGDWKQYELFSRGKKHIRNCAKTPFTCSLVDGIPDAAGCKRGQVKFSIMQPGTHVWAHTGPTNCRLRAHLGLIVPPGANIRVATETREWKEGKVIMFDDSFEHEVWHNGSSLRLVLIVDFWHPELTAYQKATLSPI